VPALRHPVHHLRGNPPRETPRPERDGRFEEFDRRKLISGIEKACEKRPISAEQIEAVVELIITELETEHGREIPAKAIGERVMRHLSKLDEVAYVPVRVGVPAVPRRQAVHPRDQATDQEMILAREDIAWVRFEDGTQAPFDEERLLASLDRAAVCCGLTDRLLAESVAAAVHSFVARATPAQTVSLAELVELVEAVLAMLGHEDVARATPRGTGARRFISTKLPKGKVRCSSWRSITGSTRRWHPRRMTGWHSCRSTACAPA